MARGLQRGVEFLFILFGAQGATVLTVKVFTLGGFMFTLRRARKKAILTLRLVMEWMSV